jgi:hypothetical protein
MVLRAKYLNGRGSGCPAYKMFEPGKVIKCRPIPMMQVLKRLSLSSVLTVFTRNALKISPQIKPNVTKTIVSCNTNKSCDKIGSNQMQLQNLIACVPTSTSSTLLHTVTWIICLICYMSQSPTCVIRMMCVCMRACTCVHMYILYTLQTSHLQACAHTHSHYIYIYVCVCVCVLQNQTFNG